MDSVRSMSEIVEGSFVFTILDNYSSLFIVKSNNPVAIIHIKELKTYVYASTEKILWTGLVNSSLFKIIKSQFLKNPHSVEEINLKDGQILKISAAGKIEYGTFKPNDTFGFSRSSYFDSCYNRVYSSPLFADEEYLAQIKSVALSLGHDQSIIDALLSEGFHFDEIEEFLYAECPQEELTEILV